MNYLTAQSHHKSLLIFLAVVLFVLMASGCSPAGQQRPSAITTPKQEKSIKQKSKKVTEKSTEKKSGIKTKPSISKKSSSSLNSSLKTEEMQDIEHLNSDFLGGWIVIESSARFDISVSNGKLEIKGFDAIDSEQFKISNLIWGEDFLKGQMKMLSTKHETQFELTFLDEDTLSCKLTGDKRGTLIWKRYSKLFEAGNPD